MVPVLAVDPSLRSTGYATITTDDNGTDHLTYDTITPGPRRGVHRELWIAGTIRNLTRRHQPHLVAIESPFAGAHANTIMALARLRGAIDGALYGEGYGTPGGLPAPLEVAPSTLKLWATGSGAADKRAMVAAAHELTSWRGTSNDIADAILLHACVADALGQPYAEPAHDRRHEALTPIVTQLDKHDLTRPPATQEPR